jgi:hypothetical protein
MILFFMVGLYLHKYNSYLVTEIAKLSWIGVNLRANKVPGRTVVLPSVNVFGYDLSSTPAATVMIQGLKEVTVWS